MGGRHSDQGIYPTFVCQCFAAVCVTTDRGDVFAAENIVMFLILN